MKALPETNHAGRTIWRVQYFVAKRRIRKTFHSKEEADAWIACNRGIAVDEGRIFWEAWHGISNDERHELMDALALMRDGRIDYPQATLVIAAKEYLGRLNAVKTSVSLDEAVEGFLASKGKQSRKGALSEGWLNVLESSLRRLARELPNKTLVEFSTEEIESYLDDQDWAPRTFNNYRNHLKDLFNWGAELKYVAENPVIKIETFSKKMLTKEVIVPAVNVVGRILKTSDTKAYRHLRPAIDAGFGLALRSSEITGMDWRNVTEKVFHVPASIAKNGKPRNIQRTPLLDGVFRILIDAGGLKPSSHAKQITFDGPGRAVIDGPFASTRELVAGFWIWNVKDMEEAVAWVKRCPNPMRGPSEIEIRPFYELGNPVRAD